MKKITFAVIFLAMAGWSGAQQVRLLGDEPADGTKASVDSSDMPQIIMPVEDTPAAEVKKATAPAAKKTVKPAAKKTAKKAAAPALAASTAAVSAAVIPPVPAAAAPVPAVKTSSKFKQLLDVKTSSAPLKAQAAEVKPVVPAKPAAPKAVPAVKPAAPVQEVKSEGGFAVDKRHTVTGGDTLWDLSDKYYSDPYKWGKIYNANLGTVADPDRIYPREELVIPGITEEVKPEVKPAPEITGGDTVKDAELSSTDIAQNEEAAAAMPTAAPAVRPAMSEDLDKYESSDLSENMPQHQKEWARGVKLVPENWRADGVVKAKGGINGNMDDSFSMGGEIVVLSMSGSGLVKPGDYLGVYLKGSVVFDKAGKSRGLELQPAGTLEVISADGSSAKARVIDSVTPISKGYVVKKK